MSSISTHMPPLSDRIDAYSRSRKWLKITRLRAFLGHLCLSTAIVSLVLTIVFLVWYPAPYFAAAGAWSIIRVLIGVDLVLGPMLTLIVFRPGKRLLIVDVAIIAIVQISALVYGIGVLYQERPYYVVFALDRFYVLAEKDVSQDARGEHPWMVKPIRGPILASARRPRELARQQQLLEETVFGNAPDIERRPEFWVPLADDLQMLADRAYSLDGLRAAGPSEARIADEVEAAADGAPLGFYPLVSARNAALAIIDLTNGRLLRVVATDPWEAITRRQG